MADWNLVEIKVRHHAGIDAHSFGVFRIDTFPVRGTTAGSAATELNRLITPDISVDGVPMKFKRHPGWVVIGKKPADFFAD